MGTFSYERDLRKLQLKVLDIAKYFVQFCKNNNLTCYFCGGGCIGAIRHKGFIPWDDDLDFFMPRDSYEMLLTIWKDNDQYVLSYPNENLVNHELCATVQDIKTTYVKDYQKNIDTVHGIGIDIFPIDGCPTSKLDRWLQIINGYLFQLFCSQVIPIRHGGIKQNIAKLALTLITSKELRYKIWKQSENKIKKYKIADCNYVTEIYAGPGYMMNQYPKSAFESAIWVPFEDCLMPIPVGYDDYLRIAFGDYMSLPPEEKRVHGHDAIIIDLDKPYKDGNCTRC